MWKIQWELEMRGIKATYGRADGPLNPVHEVLWNHLEKPRRRFQAQHREDLVRRCIEIEDEAFAEDRKVCLFDTDTPVFRSFDADFLTAFVDREYGFFGFEFFGRRVAAAETLQVA